SRAVVVIEGAVLLAGDDHVLKRRPALARPARPGRTRRGRPERAPEDRHPCGPRLLQKGAAGDPLLVLRHGVSPLSVIRPRPYARPVGRATPSPRLVSARATAVHIHPARVARR